MSESILWTGAILLGVLGIAAEANLLRRFIGDWLEERANEKAQAPRGQRDTPGDARSRSSLRAAATATVLILGAHAANATAQTVSDTAPLADPAQAPSDALPQSDPVGSYITVQLNLDYTTAYFYRGIIQEDSGLIIQPAARITAKLDETDSFKLDAFVGTWNSFHGQKTGAGSDDDFTGYWYESDIYAGVTLTTGPLSFTTSYTFLTSPSDAYETVQELAGTVALDDSRWLDEWSLKPSAMVAVETGADASDGGDSDTGVYLELGVAPALSFELGRTPITLTFPASVGLSLSNYYQDSAGNDDTFGFAQVGAKASIPLGEPGRLGAASLSTGVSVLFLGDHTSDYNSGDETEVIFSAGLQWGF